MKRAIAILTIVTMSAGILIGLREYDQSKANASDMLLVRTEIKLLYQKFDEEQKIRRSQDIQKRIWQLEDRYQHKVMPQSVKEECRSLKEELRQLRGS